jgi:hypothetical protein
VRLQAKSQDAKLFLSNPNIQYKNIASIKKTRHARSGTLVRPLPARRQALDGVLVVDDLHCVGVGHFFHGPLAEKNK